MALVLIARFTDLTEAQAAAAALRASGIPVMLQNEFHGQAVFFMQQALGGFRLWVPEEDAADARAFIATCRAEFTPQASGRPGGPALGLAAFVLALAAPVLGWTLAGLRKRAVLPEE